MDLTAFLINAQSPDEKTRNAAQEALVRAEEQNLVVFLVSLVTELANDGKPGPARQMAGLILKNTMTSKDEEKKARLEQQWIALDDNTKQAIKHEVLKTLESHTKEARQTAAQVCARIAAIELPRQQWNDLIPTLLRFVQNAKNDFQKEATLTCIGYICEESDADILQKQSNDILTAVVQGMRKEEPNFDVRYAAAKALYNSLEFVRGNMSNENERNYLMSQVCEGTQAQDPRLKEAAMLCLVKIASLYYEKLKSYMQALFSITLEAVRKEPENVGLQGIEFWSALCDVELELLQEEDGRGSEYYVKGALKHLTELLAECLTRQNAENPDEWNLATAAGTCLCLVAQTVGDDIVPHVVPFISQNANHSDWKYREAATLAFGSILDGPSSAVLGTLVDQAVPMMLQHMTDDLTIVKDTTAWTIGRIADLHPEPIIHKYLQPVLETMMKALGDEPSVASKACWCIQNVANYWEDNDEDTPTYPLSSGFSSLIQTLLRAIDRPDATENNLRSSAYEALNSLLCSAALDCLEVVKQLIPVLLQRLEVTTQMQLASGSERQEQITVQGLLCGALQVTTRKLGSQVVPFADQMMQIFLRVFSARDSTVHEECLMAVGAVANALQGDFERYMPHFAPSLYLGLKNYQESQVCNIAVGIVNDIASALGPKFAPYCDEIMTILLENLRALELNRDVKPAIIACFGDIALNIGAMFEKYLPVVMNVMDQASKTVVPESDEEMVEYLNTLRENICEAYTGILQGLKTEKPDVFLPFVGQVLEFINIVHRDQTGDEGLFRACVGVVGDLANVFGKKAQSALQQEAIRSMVATAAHSSDAQTKEAGRWTLEQLRLIAV
eukprot:NODE_212_length_2726_cov_70.298468_g194_i0.p1 GENE.NODE_212_length_2726_cov_70.298468_g194_i0~~NODE_212_length_2726_cov_70.298468_g194_i0.p1  ORF type:complete len:845 (+),score=176.99 NODE_212_length_2726_cov_70.298468_g194_i0:58-2592(+)